MDTKLRATRAVLSLLSRRVIRFWTTLALAAFALILIACLALAYYVSPWWLILLAAYIPVLLLFVGVRLAVGLFVNKLYPIRNLSRNQHHVASNFADKIQRLAETHGISWPMFAFICFKDLLLYRDLRTARNTIEDGTSLKRDFEELEKLF